MRIDPLPVNVSAPCQHPASISHGGDWEVFAGRIGDELIACGEAKAVAVAAYDEVRGAVAGKDGK